MDKTVGGIVIATEKKRAILGFKFISVKVHEISQNIHLLVFWGGTVRTEIVQI